MNFLKFQRWSDPINSIPSPLKENEYYELHEHGEEFFHGLKKEKQINLFLLIKIKK